MTKLLRLDTQPDFDPKRATSMPERLVSGDPQFKTWELDDTRSDSGWSQARTGIWEASAGKTISIKGETMEFCHILSGRVEIAEKDGDSQEFSEGDSFLMLPGFEGTWETLETVRKIFVILS